MKTLKQQYEAVVEKYRIAFFDKHKFEDDNWFWVADEIGGVLGVSDHFFNLEQIMFDIDENLPEEEIFNYYEYCLDKGFKGEVVVNMKNYFKGMR